MAQAGWNDEKNRGRKSCWTVPLTKRTMLKVLNIIKHFFLLELTVFGRFFHGSVSNPDFFADPHPDSGIKSDPDPDKRTLIRNTGKRG